MKDGVVRAAGGAVVREGDGGPEVVIVHRPKYDDWTLPEGEDRARGERRGLCGPRGRGGDRPALRAARGAEARRTSDASGRPKVARYWLMRPVGGRLRPTREIDDARWVPLRDAEAELSYDRDVRVLRSIGREPEPCACSSSGTRERATATQWVGPRRAQAARPEGPQTGEAPGEEARRSWVRPGSSRAR